MASESEQTSSKSSRLRRFETNDLLAQHFVDAGLKQEDADKYAAHNPARHIHTQGLTIEEIQSHFAMPAGHAERVFAHNQGSKSLTRERTETDLTLILYFQKAGLKLEDARMYAKNNTERFTAAQVQEWTIDELGERLKIPRGHAERVFEYGQGIKADKEEQQARDRMARESFVLTLEDTVKETDYWKDLEREISAANERARAGSMIVDNDPEVLLRYLLDDAAGMTFLHWSVDRPAWNQSASP